MISIDRDRVERPAVLDDAGLDQDLYDDPTVVDALSVMQHGKCCYCEKYIGTSGHDRAVEHFRPKSKDMFPELKNTWSNLLHACAACNGKKWKHFPRDKHGDVLIIDPSDPAIAPEDHLEFNVNDEDDLNFGRVSGKDGSELGDETIKKIGLDGVEWRRDRTAGYNRLYSAYVEILEARDDTTRTQKVRAFEMRLGANNEHAAFARAFARAKNLDTRYGVRIPFGAEVAEEEQPF